MDWNSNEQKLESYRSEQGQSHEDLTASWVLKADSAVFCNSKAPMTSLNKSCRGTQVGHRERFTGKVRAGKKGGSPP